ncbi:MAG TPA: type II toxin-antitoxin system VapC family toxin [Mycobacteriales bacterium]|nr:type II toxin-antitoxin system VapC family toxin [Mycobacteriales bacterium]
MNPAAAAIAYADSSALVKLAVAEPESASLRAALSGYAAVVSSELAIVEVTRAAVRSAGDDGAVRAAMVLDTVDLLRLDRPVLDRAARLPPTELRSLDALHIASALELRVEVDVVAYDERLLAAARVAGLRTVSPWPELARPRWLVPQFL